MSYISLYNEFNGEFSNLTVDGTIDLSNATVIIGNIAFPDGLVTAPSISFKNDLKTGFYRPGTIGTVNFTSNGVATISLNSNGINLFNNIIQVGDGSITNPSITYNSDNTTGFYKSAAGETSYTTGGFQILSINSYDTLINNRLYLANRLVFVGASNAYLAQMYCDSGGGIYLDCGGYNQAAYISSNGTWTLYNPIQNNDGSVTNPMYSFSNETGLGMYRSGTNTLSFCSNSVDALDITSTQISANVQLLVPSGSYTTPSIIFNNSEATTGIYREGINTLSIGCNGTEVIRFGPTQLQIFEALAMGSNTINCGAITSTSLLTGPITCGNIGCANINAGTNTITGGNLNLINTSNQMVFTNVIINVASASTAITYTVPNVATNSSFIMSNTNQSITGNLGINTTASSTEALKVYLASGISVGAGNEIASFGTTVSERIQIYDENVSATLGPYINFAAGNPSQIRASGNLQFWPYGRSSSILTLGNTSITFPTLASKSILTLDSSSNLITNTLTNGQLMIGSTGNAPVANTLTGTTNRITVTNGAGSITLSGPQDIATTSTPTFAGAILNGQTVIGTSAATPIGAFREMIYGTANSSSTSAGAHWQIVTSTDNYPIYHIAGIDHNNINLTFDGYYDGTTYRSSSTSGVFQIAKASNQLRFITSPGATQGNVPTLSVAGYFDGSGNFTCNNTIAVGGNISSTGQPCLIMSASSYISVLNTSNTVFNGFDTTVFSQGSITFSSNSTATVPITGTYTICFEMQFDSVSTGTGTFDSMWLVKNSTNPPTYGMQLQQVCVGSQMYLSSSATMRLTANDTIQVYVYQNSGTTLHVGSLGSGTARVEITKNF